MEGKWRPDPEVIILLKRWVKQTNPSHRIAVGTRVLNWADVLTQVERGTEFGRRYQDAVKNSLKAAR